MVINYAKEMENPKEPLLFGITPASKISMTNINTLKKSATI